MQHITTALAITADANAHAHVHSQTYANAGADPHRAASTPPDRHALAGLCLIARLHHVAADPDTLAHQLGLPPAQAVGSTELLLAARRLGLKAKLARSTAERLPLTTLPALARMADGRFVVLAQCDGQRVLFMDPRSATEGQATRPTIEPLDAFAAQWSGEQIGRAHV